MIENNSVQIIIGDQEETNMSRKDSDETSSRRRYGRPSADYYEVVEHGLKAPANDNGGSLSSLSVKTKNILKILIPLGAGLAFLAWY